MDLFSYTAQAKFSQQHLLCLQDYTPDEIMQLLSLAAKLKLQRKMGVDQTNILKGKNIALIFTKPSMRTRVSFEAGIEQLGGHAMFITAAEIGIGTRESVYDVAHVLSRFVDGIMIRTFQQSDVEGLAQNSRYPVINALTDEFHPCQALTDIFTMWEYSRGNLKGLKLAYLGDGASNMANSLMLATQLAGVDMTIAAPEEFAPVESILNRTGGAGRSRWTTDVVEALRDADFIYTDVWVSMGFEAEARRRMEILAPYQLNMANLRRAKPEAKVLHCLPAHRGEEITDDVMDSEASIVFDQAENRLHVQKAILVKLMA